MPVYEVGEILKHTWLLRRTDSSSEILISGFILVIIWFSQAIRTARPPGTADCASVKGPPRSPNLVEGGTGSRSEDIHQPGFLPDKFESGAPNARHCRSLAGKANY